MWKMGFSPSEGSLDIRAPDAAQGRLSLVKPWFDDHPLSLTLEGDGFIMGPEVAVTQFFISTYMKQEASPSSPQLFLPSWQDPGPS